MRISSPSCFSRGLLITCCLWLPANAIAAELLYLFDPDCPPCQKFESEILSIYPKTEESQLAPLHKIDIAGMNAAAIRQRLTGISELKDDVRGMPTFILVNEGQEIDRFSGYSNDELFWMSLQRLLNQRD